MKQNRTFDLKNILEAVLMGYGSPLSIEALQNIFDEENKPTREEVLAALQAIFDDSVHRGFELKQSASGYSFQTKSKYSLWVSRIFSEKPVKYSSAFIEIMAIVAYRQPVTRAEIDAIRGVTTSSGVLKSLLERGWVRISGYRDVPGKPALYVTTDTFLDDFNLSSLGALPNLEQG